MGASQSKDSNVSKEPTAKTIYNNDRITTLSERPKIKSESWDKFHKKYSSDKNKNSNSR